jgi:hypothetical protein
MILRRVETVELCMQQEAIGKQRKLWVSAGPPLALKVSAKPAATLFRSSDTRREFFFHCDGSKNNRGHEKGPDY